MVSSAESIGIPAVEIASRTEEIALGSRLERDLEQPLLVGRLVLSIWIESLRANIQATSLGPWPSYVTSS